MDIKDLLQKYFSGTLTPGEKVHFENWILKEQNRNEILNIIESEYLIEKGIVDVPPFEALLAKIRKEKSPKSKVVFLKDKWFWAACAACILFLFGGAWFGYQLRNMNEHALPIAFNTAETNPGQVAKLTLSDGSKVILAGNSSLSFPEQMKTNAVLYLDGEAYFDFVPTTNKIQIKTREFTTITNDSKLNIRAFSKDSVVKVAVAKGSAKVKENADNPPMLKNRVPSKDSTEKQVIKMTNLIPAVYVKANEQVTFDKTTKKADVTKFEGEIVPLFMLYPADYAKKPNGENLVIKFENSSLSEITDVLTKKFHLEFELRLDEKAFPKFSGTFNARENPLNILMHVCRNLHLGYQIEESIIKIYPK